MADAAPSPLIARLRGLPWWGIGGAVIFLSVAGVSLRHRSGRTQARARTPPLFAGHAPTPALQAATAPVTQEERDLLAPLTVGAPLGPTTVAAITGLRGGAYGVTVRLNGQTQTLRIARSSPSTTAMHLRSTGPYTVYLEGSGEGFDRTVLEHTWRALEDIVGHHLNLPVPAGMQPCCP